MKTELITPNVKNFVNSLRDIGYTFEIAVADIIDNSIAARATYIKIHTVAKPDIIFCMLDDGNGMSEMQLIEAMRLASQGPEEERKKNDLGRFGLGLKTASFSQCKKLTVLSKKDEITSIKQWDLDYIGNKNEWLLITPDIESFKMLPLFNEFSDIEHGTLVYWQDIDRYKEEGFSNLIESLRKHVALVFHRFLEGHDIFRNIKISINDNPVKAFNPFNAYHDATLEKATEIIQIFNSKINVTPYILPHHSKLSQSEWEEYATEEGYIKSQGFYLYRANRLLIHGTWWGLHRATDAHKLVRIKIDIQNDQDKYWGIDIKKSTARPRLSIKKDLKRIISEVTKEGSKPYTGRGRKIKDKAVTRFWEIIPDDNEFRFGLNKDHPVYQDLVYSLSKDSELLLDIYLKGLESYLPLEAIQAHLQQSPHDINQEKALTEEEVKDWVKRLKDEGVDKDYIKRLLKTEIFSQNMELFEDE